MAVRDSILGPPRIALLIVMGIIIGQGIRGEGTTATVAPARHRPIEIEETAARSTATVTVDDNLPSHEQITPHFNPTETRSAIRSRDVNHPEDLKRSLIRLAAPVAAGSPEIFEVEDVVVAAVDEHGEMIAGTAVETANRITGTDLTLGTSDLESENENETGATVTVTVTPLPREVADRLRRDGAVLLPREIFGMREMSPSVSMPSGREESQETGRFLPVRQIQILLLGPNLSGAVGFPVVDVAGDVATGTVEDVEGATSTTTQETGIPARGVAPKKGDGAGTLMTATAGILDTSQRAMFEKNGNQEGREQSVISSRGSWIGYLTNPLLPRKTSLPHLWRPRHLRLALSQVDNRLLPIFSH